MIRLTQFAVAKRSVTVLITLGLLDRSLSHPREVFRVAVISSAAAVVLMHNHPSGDPSPSREDIMVTEKLIEGGKTGTLICD